MALITKQLLKGFIRNRSAELENATLEANTDSYTQDWLKSNGIQVVIAAHSGYGRQEIFLTQEETNSLLIEFSNHAESSHRIEAAIKILSELDDADLLNFLQDILKLRSRIKQHQD